MLIVTLFSLHLHVLTQLKTQTTLTHINIHSSGICEITPTRYCVVSLEMKACVLQYGEWSIFQYDKPHYSLWVMSRAFVLCSLIVLELLNACDIDRVILPSVWMKRLPFWAEALAFMNSSFHIVLSFKVSNRITVLAAVPSDKILYCGAILVWLEGIPHKRRFLHSQHQLLAVSDMFFCPLLYERI